MGTQKIPAQGGMKQGHLTLRLEKRAGAPAQIHGDVPEIMEQAGIPGQGKQGFPPGFPGGRSQRYFIKEGRIPGQERVTEQGHEIPAEAPPQIILPEKRFIRRRARSR